ncbi:family 43 glycosylhydrolase, partial [Enterocloster sp.]|uniref:family 43 glycosylhydrolase n=1 Tax=Enterocloster sp. TaxID=2719315 RepID=UPI003A8FF6C6
MITYTSATKKIAEESFQAALLGDLDKVKQLAGHTFHLETCDEKGNSLLHYAVRSKNLELVRFLTEAGGLDLTWANADLVTPFDLAHIQAKEHPGDLAAEEMEAWIASVCGFSHEACYRNPVVRGMYPDPSIVRVGEDYYMVNSSFIFFPGIPVSHSRDLVHWETIGYVAADPDWARKYLGPLEGGRGFWAPDISYHDGWFTVCATLRMNDDADCIQTQFVARSRKPEGPYEKPVIHKVLGIDPSIFHDEDGRTYMLLNRGARIMEISEDGKECLSEPELIWYGWDKHGPEGPHILK